MNVRRVALIQKDLEIKTEAKVAPEDTREREVTNPAKVLQNQNGKFKVISPNGYIFEVTCRKGRKVQIRQMGELELEAIFESAKWQIEKIA